MTSPSRAQPCIPSPWDFYYVGRVLEQRSSGQTRRGVAKAHICKMGHDDPASKQRHGTALDMTFRVDWDDGTTEYLPLASVAKLATQRFVEEDWVMPVVLYLQRHKWEGADRSVQALEDLAKEERLAEAKQRAAAAKAPAGYAAVAKKRASGKRPKKAQAPGSLAKKEGAAGGRAKATAVKAKKTAPPSLKIPSLEDRIAAKNAAAGGSPSKSRGTTARQQPAAAAARLNLDQGASNSLGAPAPSRGAGAGAGVGDGSLTSPRGTEATGATSSGGAAGAGATTTLTGGKRKQQDAGAGPASGSPAKRPRAAAPAPAHPAVGLRADEVALDNEDLSADPKYTFARHQGQPIYKYNLRAGPDGELYRVYAKGVMVPDTKGFTQGDELCRDWKPRLAAQGEGEGEGAAYEVEHVVAERYIPKRKKREWLIKWKAYELDLGDDNWCAEEELEDAQEALTEWREQGGKHAFEKAAAFFNAAQQLKLAK